MCGAVQQLCLARAAARSSNSKRGVRAELVVREHSSSSSSRSQTGGGWSTTRRRRRRSQALLLALVLSSEAFPLGLRTRGEEQAAASGSCLPPHRLTTAVLLPAACGPCLAPYLQTPRGTA